MSNGQSGIPAIAIIAIVGGATLAYSGVKGKGISSAFQSLISGQSPASATQASPINSAGDTATTAAPSAGAGGGSNIVTTAAASQIGKPYVWDTPINASDPNPSSFDCSGLTMWCYKKAGINLPHFTGAQFAIMPHRPFAEAQPGDLVFYANDGGLNIYHVAMYMGGGQVIEAPEAGIPVRYRAVKAGDKDLVASVGVYSGS